MSIDSNQSRAKRRDENRRSRGRRQRRGGPQRAGIALTHHIGLYSANPGATPSTLVVEVDGVEVIRQSVTLPQSVYVEFTGRNGGFDDLHAVSNGVVCAPSERRLQASRQFRRPSPKVHGERTHVELPYSFDNLRFGS